MSGRLIPSWGQSGNQSPATRDIYASRDLPPLPCGSIDSSGSALELSDVSQSLRDIGFVLLSSFTAFAIVAAVFICFFVDTTSY